MQAAADCCLVPSRLVRALEHGAVKVPEGGICASLDRSSTHSSRVHGWYDDASVALPAVPGDPGMRRVVLGPP